jgi:hypothetical protein
MAYLLIKENNLFHSSCTDDLIMPYNIKYMDVNDLDYWGCNCYPIHLNHSASVPLNNTTHEGKFIPILILIRQRAIFASRLFRFAKTHFLIKMVNIHLTTYTYKIKWVHSLL